MKTQSFLVICWLLTGFVPGLAQPVYPTIGQIVRLDSRIDKLIPKEAKIEVLASGFTWSEGPVWVKNQSSGGTSASSESFLLFTDVPQNTIFKWTEKDGLSVFLKPSGYTGVGQYSEEPGANGLTIDRQGRLIACEHGDRRVSAMPLDGSGGKKTLADNYRGKRFNSPNDVIAHSSGNYYFTDPPYGMPKRENDPTRETEGFGVYRIAPNGGVTLVVGDLTRPNGLALSPDEKTLYVAQSDPAQPVIMAYALQADGSLGKGRVVFGSEGLKKQGLEGGFDGMKVDRDGNLWATGPGGVLVVSPTGDFLGHIKTGVATANCAWGDDGSTLYITADMYLCRVRTTARGW
ncbi:SMP-30/gluconolactonase/LRE family protein [Spirosoma taeanense]|uniref:SMP-30/gluconolactonase/LRE family protein n=1 Tax=Spirosoma taeanense TaxID=2735870 RepID=A0A6M5Y671_9BACT|nr:SMP-30/gluconolactonase/LRE family protein [Spirosoma taeanense]QJW88916.1 SMP-30/gluconolactonase/LRE family protein [Spirosoma taeanense]